MELEIKNTPTRQTERQILTGFIELYRNYPCLWKVKSKEYSDKFKKEEAYKVLVDHMKQLNPDIRKDDVVKKINSLRSCFRKEFKKVLASTKSGSGIDDIYKPNLWYYSLLLFLKDSEIPRPSVGNDDTDYYLQEAENDDSDVDKSRGKDHDKFASPPRTPSLSEGYSSASTNNKRKLKKKIYKEEDKSDQILALVGQKLQSSRDEDEFDIIGKNVAEKLRKIEPTMKIYAEKLINEVLFEAQLGTLKRESSLNISSGNMRSSFLYNNQMQSSLGSSQHDLQELTSLQNANQSQNVRDYYSQFSYSN